MDVTLSRASKRVGSCLQNVETLLVPAEIDETA